jgi:hypothetical protein
MNNWLTYFLIMLLLNIFCLSQCLTEPDPKDLVVIWESTNKNFRHIYYKGKDFWQVKNWKEVNGEVVFFWVKLGGIGK